MPPATGALSFILNDETMNKVEILNANAVEIAIAYHLLKGTCDFFDKLFENMEFEDPQYKKSLMSRTEGLLGGVTDRILILKENNDRLIWLEQLAEQTGN